MEKRLKKLLLYYISAFLLLVLGGCISMQWLNGELLTHNFLLSLSAVSLRGGNFGDLLETRISAHIIVLILTHGGALLWLFFSLQFANIIGQARIFHNFKSQENNTLPASTILGKALIYILILEAFFSITLYAFGQKFASDEITSQAIFNGVSVALQSGFNFQLYTQAFNEAYIFQLVIGGLLIIGRLGYPVFYDLCNLQRLRQRLLHLQINWTLQTRVSIYFTAALLLFGAVFFWLAEVHILKQMKIVSAGISVLFNVSAWAGAGLYTFFPEGIFLGWLAAVLMLAGNAAGSFGLLSYGLYANLFGRGKIRKVALAVLVYCLFAVCTSALIIWLLKPVSFYDSLFYSISVFTGSGLYMQAFLSPAIYVFLLLAGRIGVPVILVLAYLKFCKNEKPSELMYI